MPSKSLSFVLSVPGKIILMGEHSILYKKIGIAASINKRTHVRFKLSDEPVLELHFPDLKLNQKWNFHKILDLIRCEKPLFSPNLMFSLDHPKELRHEEMVTFIYEHSDLNLDGFSWNQKSALIGFFYVLSSMYWSVDADFEPFCLELNSELCIGAGTGSSAAYSVGIVSALFLYMKRRAKLKFGSGIHNISKPDFEPFHLDLTDSTEFTNEEKKLVNKWAYLIERVQHGTPSGLDNTVCTYGKVVKINDREAVDGEPSLEHVADIPALKILLINSHVSRTTADLVRKVADLRKLCPNAVDSVLNAMDIVAREFIGLLGKLGTEEGSDMQIYRELEGLIDIQHGLLNTLGVSHIRLEEICMITRRRGFHSKLTGAGGGGYVFALIPPDADQSTVSQTMADLISSGFHVEEIAINSVGLSLDSCSN